MPTIDEAFATAFAHHQAGLLREAEQLYRQILSAQPGHAGAWHHLGLIADQAGHLQAAAECMQHAVEIQPHYAEAWYGLGLALHKLGRLHEARRCYEAAAALKPDYAQAYNNLGLVLEAALQLADAVECFRRAAALQPELHEAHFNLANALKNQGQLVEAEASYRRALQLAPNWVEAHCNRGVALEGQGRFEEAVACYQRALELRPGAAEVYCNLGSSLQKLGRLAEAIEAFRRATQYKPALTEAHFNLAAALYRLGDLAGAADHYRRVLDIQPQHAEAHNGLGLALHEQGDLAAGEAHYRRSLALKPQLAEARWNWALFRLLKGDFDEGWREFEWRWKTGDVAPRGFAQPRWNGEPLAGRTILLHAEQGLGDTFQFIRYAAAVKSRGATVVVECQRPLLNILRSAPGIDRLVAYGDELPPFDLHAPLMSLPSILKTTLGSIPAHVPYLWADAALVAEWRAKLAALNGFRIGINWHGRGGAGTYRERDIPLECFARLAEIPGVRLIRLQKSPHDGRAEACRQRFSILDLGDDLDTAHGAFMDTAAIMMNLDLVITSDTSVPHLAGALGAPVWVALPHVPNWRWLLDRADSPWYPTMRLFRQRKPGTWDPVFGEMEAALRDHVAERAAGK